MECAPAMYDSTPGEIPKNILKIYFYRPTLHETRQYGNRFSETWLQFIKFFEHVTCAAPSQMFDVLRWWSPRSKSPVNWISAKNVYYEYLVIRSSLSLIRYWHSYTVSVEKWYMACRPAYSAGSGESFVDRVQSLKNIYNFWKKHYIMNMKTKF